MFKQYSLLIETKQTEVLIKLTGLFWLCEKLIGWRVWSSYRFFPTAPVFTFLDAIPAQIHLVLFVIELFLILGIIFLNNTKPIFIGLLVAEILSCMLDQTRLQPYEYQCIVLAFVFLINGRNKSIIAPVVVFILASTYFYSGIGKFNEGFLKVLWENMILKQFLKIPAHVAGNHWVYRSGYFLGLGEMIAGIGLFFPGIQKKAALFLIMMHLFVLALIGPWGLNYNKVVWPWNVAMILYLFVIFMVNYKQTPVFGSIFTGWNKAVFALFGILPALNTIGYWDNYLSSALYSGKLPKMIISVGDTTKCIELKPFFKKNKLFYYKGNTVIDIQTWGLTEMNTLPYPEFRVLKQIAVKMERKYPDAALTPFYFINGRIVNNK